MRHPGLRLAGSATSAPCTCGLRRPGSWGGGAGREVGGQRPRLLGPVFVLMNEASAPQNAATPSSVSGTAAWVFTGHFAPRLQLFWTERVGNQTDRDVYVKAREEAG